MAEMKIIVQKIERIEEHPNADRLEIAFTDILDWPMIVGKDNFVIGDKVVHFPVDCVVDDKLEGILLGESKMKLSKGRIRAIKIRKVVSYGMLCPWDEIQSHYRVKESSKNLMKDLGAHKYEPPVKGSPGGPIGNKTKKRQNREFAKYFDMNHLQNCKGVFEEGDTIIVTEKLHGTSFRAGWVKRDVTGFFGHLKQFFRGFFDKDANWEFVYGSRNVQLQNRMTDGSLYGKMVDKLDLKTTLKKGMVIYGEIVGPNIQRNYKYTKEPTLYIYDIKVNGEYVGWKHRQHLCFALQLNTVPHVYTIIDIDAHDTEMHWKNGSMFPGIIIEGVVMETKEPEIGKFGRKKVKVLNPKYLLNKENTDFH